MTDFKDRVYKGKNDALYNEILDEAIHLLKENPMGLAILKGANYKDVISKEEFDRAEADMKSETTPGFAVETVYVGFYDKEKGSPDGARCYLAMADNSDNIRNHARGEVYLSSTYIQSALDSFNGNKMLTSLYLTNVLAHEFTHGNQETKIINEISDCISPLPDDPKKEDRRRGSPKDGGIENMIITEANSDTAGFMVLKDILKSVLVEEKEPIVKKYLEDIYQHGWIRSKDSLAFLKEGLMTEKEIKTEDVFDLMITEKIKTNSKNFYFSDFNEAECEKWAKVCHQKHLFQNEDRVSLAQNVVSTYVKAMDEHKTHMAQSISPKWLSELHPNPKVFNGTNVEYLFQKFYHKVQGKDKTKIPTDEEIKAQADAYFKEFGIEGFADTFMQEVRIKEYTNLIKRNAKDLTVLQEIATCQENHDGSWALKINQEDDHGGKHIVETREIHIKKELADEIFAVALEHEMRNEATYHLYEAEYKNKKEHHEFDYQTADKDAKNAFKRDAIAWYTKNMESYYHLYEEEYRKEHPDFNYDTANKEEKTAFKKEAVEWAKKDANSPISKTEAYVEAHRDELSKLMQEKLLKEKILEQVIVNYATSKTIENADKETYQSKNDIGHCSKSVLTYMYQLQKENGGYAFLPEDTNVAAQPQKLFEHFNENWPHRTEKRKDIASAFKTHKPPYEEGTLALIDNNHGRHLMMYRGLNKDGEPEFLGFNPLSERQILIHQKSGEIIDIPSLIRDESRGVLLPPQKQITAANLQESERGIVAVDMSITRTADGESIQGFEGKIEIPNPVQSKPQNTNNKIKEDNVAAQTILQKTGRPYAQRRIPRVNTETQKELKKLGFWNIFKKSHNNGK